MTTPNLALPELSAAQAQKHVTHNEALQALDAIVQLSVKSRRLAAPPGAPADGARWIVAAGASGAWEGKSGQVASRLDGAWRFYPPQAGWLAFAEDEGLLVHSGAGWASALAVSPFGASIGLAIAEQEVTLAGASVDTTIVIPTRAIVLAVSTRTTEALTGATSYNCGVAGDPSKFGGSLGAALGASNVGVIGPTAYYADTPIRLTAVGGNFSGGKVRVAIQYIAFAAPLS